jgi:hypothetical protein
MLRAQRGAAVKSGRGPARRNVTCCANSSFQAQRLRLQDQLLDALSEPDADVARVHELVLKAKASIQHSADYRQFERCWSAAEQQHNSPSGQRLRGPAPAPSTAADARPWAWAEVSSLVLYGLGSLGAYIPLLASGAKQRK